MSETNFVTTRTTVLSALFFVMLMLGVPSFFTAGNQFETAETASGEDVDRNFIVAVADLAVTTLNPNTYTMVNEGSLIFPCYSTLTQFDLDMQVIGDLAQEWSCSPDGLTWYFKIVNDAYFCDPAAPEDKSHPATAYDVEFSYLSIQENKLSRMYWAFPDVIESFDVINDYEFTITLNGPFSLIEESWRGAPILPKYYWEDENFMNFENIPCVGSGAFYYATDGLPLYGQAVLTKSPIWYGETNHGWQMHVDNWILLEKLDDNTMWLDVIEGQPDGIDVMMGVNPDRYTANLLESSTPGVHGFSQSNGFVYEFNLNQMTDELRQDLAGAYLTGSNNQLLVDETVKLAMSYCVDKYGFVEDVLLGLGAYADSLVAAQNPGHYWYPNPDPYNPVAAREMLYEAGWQYRLNGVRIELTDSDYSTYYPLCKVGGTDPLQFRFATLNNDPLWETGAKYLITLTRQGGFDLMLEILDVSVMNDLWFAADYDTWLWDWVIGVTGDPVGTMELFTYEAIGSDQDVYWVNETFDALYYEALGTMDTLARRALSDQMQAMAYEMRGCHCVAYRDELYAVNTNYWALESLGDWNESYFLLPDIWNWWSSMQMYPIDNEAPDLYYYPDIQDAEVGVSEFFSANANDDDATTDLEYRWFWGDGTKSDWSSDNTASHTYTRDDYFQADVAVREATPSNGKDDFFMVSKGFTVVARDSSNEPPEIVSFSVDPADPNTGTVMWFNSSATDAESDDIYYTWVFGDGHTLSGQNVRYQYTEDGSYTLTLEVDDHRVGAEGSRPVTRNQLVSVAMNHAPTISVGDRADVDAKMEETFTATASDVDSTDSLRFTWIWGDGLVTVTDVPTADHTYNTKGTYTLTVWADDLTGLEAHNVSDTGLIYVTFHGSNDAPVILEWTADDVTPYTGQLVTFTATASDGNGDALTFTVEFGDGATAVQSFGVTTDNWPVTFTTTHTYTSGASESAYLSVTDGIATDGPDLLTITVTSNSAPVISPLEVKYGDTGTVMSFSAEVFDPDFDTMTYYWAWGDGTFTATADPTAEHTYDESITSAYRFFADDGRSHNSTALADVFVNSVPTLEPLIDYQVAAGDEWTFVADVDDSDLLDVLSCTWYFGDGSDPAYGEKVAHTYDTEGDYVFNVTVTDGFALETHTLYSEATMTVLAAGVNYPPTIDPLLLDLTGTVDSPVAFEVHASDPNTGDTLTVTWNFGDGSGDFVGAVGEVIEHTYTAAMTYTYTVEVADAEFTVSDSADVVISEDLPPIADAGEDLETPEDVPALLDGEKSWDDVEIVDYAWTVVELSDTVHESTETVYYTFDDPGVYTVELVVTDSLGQTSAPDTVIVTVTDATGPEIVATVTSPVDMGGTVVFNATGTTDEVDNPADLSYAWVFSDGTALVTLTTMVASHTFDLAGSFPVNLAVTDTSGNAAYIELTVTVTDTEDPVPVADVSPDPAEVGEAVTLDASGSTDNMDGAEDMVYEWEFADDGVTVTLTDMVSTHEFVDLGDIDITLTVTDVAGNVASLVYTLTVQDTTDPVAVANADLTTITVGGAVSFDATGSSDNDEIASYAWDFGDDSTVETGLSVDHVFATVGSYVVTLTVTDMSGNSATATVAITVEEEVVNVAPTAVAAATPASVVVGGTVTFSSTGSSDSDGTIASYEWTIMSGTTLVTTLTTATATHTFTAAGTYTVTLNVTDDGGLWDTASVTVTVTEAVVVNEPPSADASASDTSVTVDTEVEFSAVDSSDDVAIETWNWTITDADGNLVATLNGEEVAYTFDEAGTYTVTLNVTDAEGLYDTDSVTITVTEEDTTPEEKSFIEKYGVYLGVLAAVIVVALVAMMLLKKKKGGSTEPIAPSDEQNV